MAVRAGQVRIGGRPAHTVDQLERERVVPCCREVAVGPAHQPDDHRIQVEGAVGQPVLVPVGVGAIAHALEHPVGDELSQALGEDVARDAEVALHLAIAAHPEERLAQDQKRPAIAEDVHAELDRVARRSDRCVVPTGQLVRDPI